MPFTSSNKLLCWWDVYVISNPSVQSFAKENIASVVFQSSGRISTFQFKIKMRFFTHTSFFFCMYVCLFIYLRQGSILLPRQPCESQSLNVILLLYEASLIFLGMHVISFFFFIEK